MGPRSPCALADSRGIFSMSLPALHFCAALHSRLAAAWRGTSQTRVGVPPPPQAALVPLPCGLRAGTRPVAACETGLHPWAPSSTRPGPKTMWADSWVGRRTGGYASSFLAVWLGRLHLFLSLCGCQPTAPQEAACAMDTSGAGALKCLWGTRSALEPGGILGGPGACCP